MSVFIKKTLELNLEYVNTTVSNKLGGYINVRISTVSNPNHVEFLIERDEAHALAKMLTSITEI